MRICILRKRGLQLHKHSVPDLALISQTPFMFLLPQCSILLCPFHWAKSCPGKGIEGFIDNLVAVLVPGGPFLGGTKFGVTGLLYQSYIILHDART